MPNTPTKPALRIVRRTATPAWTRRRYDEPRPDGPEAWGSNRWRQTLTPFLRLVK